MLFFVLCCLQNSFASQLLDDLVLWGLYFVDVVFACCVFLQCFRVFILSYAGCMHMSCGSCFTCSGTVTTSFIGCKLDFRYFGHFARVLYFA